MKVLHLPYGGQMIIMCQALRKIGIEATSCHFQQGRFQFKPDLCLHTERLSYKEKIQKQKDFLQQAAKEYDLFHFHFGATFLPDYSDLAYLKSLGKKLIMQHRGSEVRRLSIARKLGNPYVTVKRNWRDEKKIIASLQHLSQYIDHAIVADHELFPYIKDYYKHVHLIRQLINPTQFSPAYPPPWKLRPVIVHSPSHLEMKGTKYILEAINKLKRKKRGRLRFKFLLLENLTHAEVLKAFRKADIIIDQLRIGAFGITSLEAMAFGKPVICYIRPDLERKYPRGLPIVNANPNTIYQALKKLLKHPRKRKRLGLAGRKYIQKNYHFEKVAQDLAQLYKTL